MRVDATNIYDGWVKLMQAVMEHGDTVAPIANTGSQTTTKELLGTSLYIENALANIISHPVRNLNYKFMIAEWLWIQAGRRDVETIARYNKPITVFSDNGATFEGAYGPRLQDQWMYIVGTLSGDLASRRAVTTIWTPNPRPTKDYPCTLSAQFIVRRGKLHSIWTMRSNDLWLGLPYDFFNFSMLTNNLAAVIGGLEIGSLTLNCGSSHLYEPNWIQAADVVDEWGFVDRGRCYDSPRLTAQVHPTTMLNVAAYDGGAAVPSVDHLSLIERLYVSALRSKNKLEAFGVMPKEKHIR